MGSSRHERPAAHHLTEFYIWMALGGVVGGLFNTLAAPALFSRVVEYPVALALVAFFRPARPTAGPRLSIDRALPVIAAVFVAAVLFVPFIATKIAIVLSGLATLAFLAMTRRHQPSTLAGVAAAMLVGVTVGWPASRCSTRSAHSSASTASPRNAAPVTTPSRTARRCTACSRSIRLGGSSP